MKLAPLMPSYLVVDSSILIFYDRKGKLEGVVICGGEPTINKDLPQFIEKIKNLGYVVRKIVF